MIFGSKRHITLTFYSLPPRERTLVTHNSIKYQLSISPIATNNDKQLHRAGQKSGDSPWWQRHEPARWKRPNADVQDGVQREDDDGVIISV